MGRRYILQVVMVLLVLSSCGRSESDVAPTTGSAAPAHAPVADLVRSPPAANHAVALDAYSTHIGEVAPSFVGQCPTWVQTLTDQPFSGSLRILDTIEPNVPPASVPALIIPDREDLPYHARFKGHFGDSAYASCPNAQRIFVVDAIERVYAQQPADDRQIHPQLSDTSTWQVQADTTFGYRLRYPPDWNLTPLQEPGAIQSMLLRSPHYPQFPIAVRTFQGEAHADPQDLASAPELVRDGRVIVQNQIFGAERIASQGLSAYRVNRGAGTISPSVAVVLNANGYAHEISLQYTYDVPQSILDTLSAMVASFQLDGVAIAAPAVAREVVILDSAFLREDQAIEKTSVWLATQYPQSAIKILSARLISEAETRTTISGCNTIQGHLNGIWLITVYGEMDGALRTVEIALHPSSGEFLCGGEVDTVALPTQRPGAPRATSTAAPMPTDVPRVSPNAATPGITPATMPTETTATPQFPTTTETTTPRPHP